MENSLSAVTVTPRPRMRARRWRLAGLAAAAVAMDAHRKAVLRETVREMVYHAYEGYKQFSFP